MLSTTWVSVLYAFSWKQELDTGQECSTRDTDCLGDCFIGKALHAQLTDVFSFRHQIGETLEQLLQHNTVGGKFGNGHAFICDGIHQNQVIVFLTNRCIQ